MTRYTVDYESGIAGQVVPVTSDIEQLPQLGANSNYSGITYDDAYVAHGSMATKHAPQADDVSYISYGDSSSQNFQSTALAARAYFYFTAMPSGTYLSIYDNSDNWAAAVGVNTDGKMYIRNAAGTIHTGAETLTINQWLRFEIYATSGSGNATITAAIYSGENTTPIEELTASSTTTSSILSSLRVGKNNYTNYATPYWADSLLIDTAATGLIGSATIDYPFRIWNGTKYLQSNGYIWKNSKYVPVFARENITTDPTEPQEPEFGSLPIGQASYLIPTTGTVKYVSPTGNDSNSGTLEAPYKTLARAASQTPAGGTIVLRAGVYHEGGCWWRADDATAVGNASLVGAAFTNTNMTVQNYPSEEVWFDGSIPTSGWTFDGTNWRLPFVTKFDHTPTHTRGDDSSNWPGGGEGTEGFVVSEFPYAAWPEQVFVDGQQLAQVGELSQLGSGKFFVEGSMVGGNSVNKNVFISTAYVMRDNPAGKEVRISNLQRLGTATSSGFIMRGIGIRRYSASLVDWGSFYIGSGSNAFVENCVIEDSAVLGLHSRSPDATFRHLTIRRCGCEGFSAGGDGGTLERSLFQNNVNHRFNYGPDGGDIKLGKVWNFTIRNNRFEDTFGHAIWFDESCFKNNIYSNDFFRQYGFGIAYEISSRAYIVDNYFEDVGIHSDIRSPHLCNPIWLSGSNQCQVWNNTIVNSYQHIKIAQDYRVPTASAAMDRYGRDDSRPAAFYDGSDPSYEYNGVMTWTTGDLTIKNNVFYSTVGGGVSNIQNVFYTVSQDMTNNLRGRRSTADFDIKTGGNLYNRLNSSTSPRFANGIYSSDSDGIEVYTAMTNSMLRWPASTNGPSWQALTGEAGSRFVDGINAATDTAFPITISPSVVSTVTPQPLDATVANLTGRTPGEMHLGAWRA